MLKTIHGGLRRSERGQDMVEFAIIAPLLMIIVMGMIDFGMVFNAYITITHAAREGARYASVGNYDSKNGTGWLPVIDDTLKAAGQTTNSCPSPTYAHVCVTVTPDPPPSAGGLVHVTVNTNVPLLSAYIINIFGASPFPLSSPAQMSFEGPKE